MNNGAEIYNYDPHILNVAANGGHFNLVKFLVKDCDFDINVKDKDGWTPLHFAAAIGSLDIVKFLVNNEAKINHSDAPALILAVRGGHFDVVKYLVNSGAEIEARGKEGTALFYAAKYGHHRIVEFLTENGAEPNSKIRRQDWLPLHESSRLGDIDSINNLVQNGADLGATGGAQDWTPLHAAAGYGNVDAVDFLGMISHKISLIKIFGHKY